MKTTIVPTRSIMLSAAGLGFAVALGGCASYKASEPAAQGPMRKETIHAVTAANQLITFNAGQPGKILAQKPLTGLQANEKILGIDYRVAKGWLYAIGSSGRLYRLDTASGAATAVSATPLAVMPAGDEFAFDFNPTVDRIRFMSNTGQNMRIHPDTGAVVDSDANTPGLQLDGKPSYAAGDQYAGQAPAVVGAAYTYNKQNDKMTTTYVLDGARGTLATMGSREGVTPAVSPNGGQLFTVGSLGIGAMQKASFDISDLSNTAYVAVSNGGVKSGFYEVNLQTGKATMIGSVGSADSVVGIAIEP